MQPADRPEDVFARRMREVRTDRGLSQSQVAAALADHGIKVDPTAVTRMEKATRAVRLDEASAVAQVLDVPLPMLLSDAPSREEAVRQAKRAWTAAVGDAARARGVLAEAEAAEQAAKERYRRLRRKGD